MSTTPPVSQLWTVRLAVMAIFLVNGAVLAVWAAQIPIVQANLALTEGVLGLAILAVPLGSLPTLLLGGKLVAMFGSQTVIRISAVLYALSLVPPIVAPNFAVLVLALFFMGACNGAMDVAMNTQASLVEQRLQKPLMSSIHALWSVGGFAGAALVSLLLALGLAPLQVVLSIAVVLLFISMGAVPFLLVAAHAEEKVADAPVIALPRGALFGLAVLVFLAFISEGALLDWSAVYLARELGTDPAIAALGFATYSLMMAVGRATGDVLVRRLGQVAVVRGGSLLAAAGLTLSLLAQNVPLALLGFACVGAGLANTVPLLFSAAGRVPGVPSGTGIAAVTSFGYFGGMVAPPLIGLVAEQTSLRVALALTLLGVLTIALRAPVIVTATAGQVAAPPAEPQQSSVS